MAVGLFFSSFFINIKMEVHDGNHAFGATNIPDELIRPFNILLIGQFGWQREFHFPVYLGILARL